MASPTDWLGPIVLTTILVWQFGQFIPRPKRDAPRIKRDFEGNGARVHSIEPAGFDLEIFRRSRGYRKYDIVVEHPLKGRREYTVGVSVSPFHDGLKRY